MQRVKKYDLPDMSDKPDFNSVHTAVCTGDGNKFILVDRRDLHVFDLQ